MLSLPAAFLPPPPWWYNYIIILIYVVNPREKKILYDNMIVWINNIYIKTIHFVNFAIVRGVFINQIWEGKGGFEFDFKLL